MMLHDQDILDVCMATVMSCRVQSNPIWTMVAGPSGVFKTSVLTLFTGPMTHHVTGSTENALVSGMTIRDEEGNRQETSLLARINRKCWIIKDLSHILQTPLERRNKIFALLRDAYDGHVCLAYGGRANDRTIETHFSILAATTSVFENAINTTDKAFGERFLVFRFEGPDRMAVTRHVLGNANEIAGVRSNLREQVQEFMAGAYVPSRVVGRVRDVHKLADFTALARSPVIRNQYRPDEIETIPEAEYGTRVASQYHTLAVICSNLGANTQRIIKRYARSTIPLARYMILEQLHRRSVVRVDDLADCVKLGEKTIRRVLEDMHMLGILRTTKAVGSGAGRKAIVYSIAPEVYKQFEAVFNDRWMED